MIIRKNAQPVGIGLGYKKAPTPALPLRGREQKVPLWGI